MVFTRSHFIWKETAVESHPLDATSQDDVLSVGSCLVVLAISGFPVAVVLFCVVSVRDERDDLTGEISLLLIPCILLKSHSLLSYVLAP